jgi:iron complex outermembrane receptor protein
MTLPTACRAIRCWHVALLAVSAQGFGSASAQEPATLDPVVITGATTSARHAAEQPYAISTVDTDAVRNAGPMVNLSEALVQVPGLVVNNRNNYAQDLQISARGFGARAGFGVRGLRLYADGIPATGPDGQGQVGHFDLAGAERIEVLRGPFSVLYGNSSGGVIALFSAPVKQPRVEVAVDAGSFGLRQVRLGVATPLAGGFEFSADLAQMELDGFRPQSSARRVLGNARLAWQGTQDRVVVLVSNQDQQAQDPLGLTSAQFNANARQTTPEAIQFNTRKTIRQTQAGANWQHTFADTGPLVQSQLSVYGGSRGVTQYLAIAPGTQAPPRHSGGLVDFDRLYSGADGRLTWQLGPVDLVTGVNVETQRDDRRGYENFLGTGAEQVLGVQGALRRNEVNLASTHEAYAQAEWRLATDWAATAGVRSGRLRLEADDHFLSNGNDSGALTYRYITPVLGLRWQARPELALHASAGRGYESPTLGELAYRADGSSGFNTGLQAQTSQQVEFGAKLRTHRHLSLDGTVFLIDTENEIGVQTNAGGRSAFQNVGRTRRYGAELEAQWRLSPQWRTQAALSWLSARYRDAFLTCAGIPCTSPTAPVAAGNRIAGTQPFGAWAQVAWKPWVEAEAALEWRAMGRTPVNDLNSDFAPAYGVLGLRWSQRWHFGSQGDRLELLARLDNLLNHHYAGSVIVNDANSRFFEPGSGRNGLVSVRWVREM